MKRCFIALALPDDTAAALARVQQDLASRLHQHARPRWVPRINLHLTLKFLGPRTNTQLERLCADLQYVAAAQAPLAVELAGLGAFGGARPTSMYASVGRGRDDVLALMAAVEDVSAVEGHAARVPHVTLARLARHGAADPDDSWLAQQAGVVYGPVDGGGLVLYESVLAPAGSQYVPLRRMAFARTRV